MFQLFRSNKLFELIILFSCLLFGFLLVVQPLLAQVNLDIDGQSLSQFDLDTSTRSPRHISNEH